MDGIAYWKLQPYKPTLSSYERRLKADRETAEVILNKSLKPIFLCCLLLSAIDSLRISPYEKYLGLFM